MGCDVILTREEAAERVGRSARTIRRWESQGALRFVGGRVREWDLLRVDQEMRERRARRRPARTTVVDEIAERAARLTGEALFGRERLGQLAGLVGALGDHQATLRPALVELGAVAARWVADLDGESR
jgi:hypothetical protein